MYLENATLGDGLKLGDGEVFVVRTARIPIVLNTTNPYTGENKTGFFLPNPCQVIDVFLHVKVADTAPGENFDIGTDGSGSNDPDGFADALLCTSTGIIRPGVTVTAGASETYFAANTRGALLSTFLAGSDAATDVGTYVETPDGTSGGDEITYTQSAQLTVFVGDIIIRYLDLSLDTRGIPTS